MRRGRRPKCRLQLCARGASWRAVAEGKEKAGRNDELGSIGKTISRGFNERRVEKGNRCRCNSDWRASSVTITEAAALARLAVAALIVVIVPDTGTCCVVISPMCADSPVLDDREATVHCTRVQLHRLGQTHGEPEREHAGETARDPITTHGSNIR